MWSVCQKNFIESRFRCHSFRENKRHRVDRGSRIAFHVTRYQDGNCVERLAADARRARNAKGEDQAAT